MSRIGRRPRGATPRVGRYKYDRHMAEPDDDLRWTAFDTEQVKMAAMGARSLRRWDSPLKIAMAEQSLVVCCPVQAALTVKH